MIPINVKPAKTAPVEKKKKKKLLSILFKVIKLFAVFYLVASAGWVLFGPSKGMETLHDWMGQDDILGRADLKEKIRPGAWNFVSAFTGTQAGTVCVLYPRNPLVVGNPDDLGIAKISAHLSARGIVMEEKDFGIIYWINDRIKLAIYRISGDLGIVENTPESLANVGELPDNFEATQCASLEEAKIFRTMDSKILLGKNKTPKEFDAF